ncbi:hypothetical protein ACFY8P_04830 [Streptomyces sp. NPDC012693]|jgi:energy-converting hydrogenase Eha subunit E|uniref:hypothetical protein n=1 Tax=unclassified Streptomyces TaxID=2593676 RepID=UPI00202FF51D|nr:hypothetical protein [Streptomyces sp. MSC1_001]
MAATTTAQLPARTAPVAQSVLLIENLDAPSDGVALFTLTYNGPAESPVEQ